jgi:outer membrane protein assembly factor BamB
MQWLAMTVPGWIAPGSMVHIMIMMWTPMLALGAFALWWLFASRLAWKDRFIILGGCAALGAAAVLVYDPSMRSMGGMTITFNVLPIVTLVWIVWLVATMLVRWPIRRYGLLLLFALIWGYFGLVRMEGVDGTFKSKMAYRWDPTSEELFLSQSGATNAAIPSDSADAAETLEVEPADWPGFRGVDRDGCRTGVKIAIDWSAKPPRELWRHRVGPAWSSFAVVGNRAYTQEQRGDYEAVVCYDASTGSELWSHRDQTRFAEAIAGPGPRATPTFHEGKLYAQGANGQLNCLDAVTGEVVWTRDIVKDSDAKLPTWGMAASPLVAAGIVTVFAGGPEGKSVLGYDAATGEIAWSAGVGEFSYCSTQLSRLAGVDQVLVSTEKGVTAFDPARGTVLWQHDWPLAGGMARVVQPAVVGGSDVLIGTGFGNGTQRVHVSREGDSWKTKEIWWSRTFKPYYNDFVVHQNHLYGFDSNIFVCVNLEDGKVKWKARGYGNGEVLLLADQGLLLVLSEQGEVALLDATPDRHVELCRINAITGKTWNHPVVARGKLFVRNAEEAACYELAELEESKSEL